MTEEEKLKELREEYKRLYGKAAPGKSKSAFLEREIAKKKPQEEKPEEKVEEVVTDTSQEVLEEAHKMNEIKLSGDAEFEFNGETFPYRKGREYAIIQHGAITYKPAGQIEMLLRSQNKGTDVYKKVGFEGFPEGNSYSFNVQCKECGK